MDRIYEQELKENFKACLDEGLFQKKQVYLFGHCEATLTLADMLLKEKVRPIAILDNSEMKYGLLYQGIPVQPPDIILKEDADQTVVLIVMRFYESMNAQLRRFGFKGEVRKMVDYNTYAEYSLKDDVIERKQRRLEDGKNHISELKKRYPGHLLIFCPFQALGDIYFCMSYLPAFLKKRGMDQCVLCVVGKGCASVVSLFRDCPVEMFGQKELEAAVQACLHEQDQYTFIAHQDRPYVVDLNKALYLKKIPLEKIYCCGVFGLPQNTRPFQPSFWDKYPDLENIPDGRSVILSPYAKSVPALHGDVWEKIIADYTSRGYQIFTNVIGNEKPLNGTAAISPKLSEMKSVVERAGAFIGIRSGLCDVIRTADCKKVALYPDYNYCDTKWKSIDMYSIEGFENMVIKDGVEWKRR